MRQSSTRRDQDFFAVSSLSVRRQENRRRAVPGDDAHRQNWINRRKMWDNITSAAETCAEGSYVKVQGKVSKYPPNSTGKWQITVSKAAPGRGLRGRHGGLRSHHQVRYRRNVDRTPRLRGCLPRMQTCAASSSPSSTTRPLAQPTAPLPPPRCSTTPGRRPAGARRHPAARLSRKPRLLPRGRPDLLVTGAILHDIGRCAS